MYLVSSCIGHKGKTLLEPGDNRNPKKNPPGKSFSHKDTSRDWSQSREGVRKKYLNFSPLPLVSPIHQSKPDISQQGSLGETVIVISL